MLKKFLLIITAKKNTATSHPQTQFAGQTFVYRSVGKTESDQASISSGYYLWMNEFFWCFDTAGWVTASSSATVITKCFRSPSSAGILMEVPICSLPLQFDSVIFCCILCITLCGE